MSLSVSTLLTRNLHDVFGENEPKRRRATAEPEELGNPGRIHWEEDRNGEPPAVAGTDFIIVRDGRIAATYLFFDKLP